MNGGNYLHWLVTARVNSHSGKLGPGDGFRPFRTKGDDGGRHRRRRKVNLVFMSWCFDRPDFLDLESHSGCRTSGVDGRYFSHPPDRGTANAVSASLGGYFGPLPLLSVSRAGRSTVSRQ